MKATFAGIARSLRHRNYRLFFSGQTFSLIGTWLTRVARGWLAYRLSGIGSFDPRHGRLRRSDPDFSHALHSPAYSSDRWNNHRVLVIIAGVLSALQSASLALLPTTGRITITAYPRVIVCSASFKNIINAFDIPARQSLVVQMIDDRRDVFRTRSLSTP